MGAPQAICCDVQTTLRSMVQESGYGPLLLGKVTILGIDAAPLYVILAGRPVHFYYNRTAKVIFSYLFTQHSKPLCMCPPEG